MEDFDQTLQSSSESGQGLITGDLEERFRQFSEETQERFEEESIILNDENPSSDESEDGDSQGSTTITLTVDTLDDQNDGSSVNGLSLRDAILRSQSDLSNDYIIYLGSGVHSLFIQGNSDSIFSEAPGVTDDIVTRTGDLDIDNRVTIIGLSASETIIDASNLGDRVFDVRSGGFLTLENVTIQEGTAANTVDENGTIGGGIRVNTDASAIINNSIIADNSTETSADLDSNGGGIANLGFMDINNTIVSGNLSGDDAGGIFNSGTMNITGSSIVGNFANAAAVEVIEAGGGGIYNAGGGSLIVRNSTISGNITGDGGGGILSEASQTLVINSTITQNSAEIGSGILSVDSTGEVLLQNSIVAENTDSADIEGFFAENSANNLIGNGNGILLNGIRGNRVGDILSPLDPEIGPLQDNGGLTPTHALLENSPAINGGENNFLDSQEFDLDVLTVDQRELRRISQDIVDIGSYEFIPSDSLLNSPLYRFQNEDVLGTYLYAGLEERDSINDNNPEFTEEGLAFYVGVEASDQLIPIYRFQNSDILGTYLYVGEEERQSVLQNNPNFVEEGIAFYVYGASANQGEDIYRFQNTDLPGTYLFVGEEERQSILQNNPNFVEEGVAFEVSF